MSRIIRVIIQNSLHQNREEVKNREIRKIPDPSIIATYLIVINLVFIITIIFIFLGKTFLFHLRNRKSNKNN